MSMGENATKYYLKTSPKSPGMKNVGVHRSVHCIQNCCFNAKETGNLLKKAGNWYVHHCLNKAPKVSLKVQKCDMHQKHKVTNYCRQGCYGQGNLGINQIFKVRQKSGKSFDVVKVRILILREDLTRIPERHISNFDPLGKGKLPQSQVLPDASILRCRICLHNSASTRATVC